MAVNISAELLSGKVCALEVQPDLTIRALKETMKKASCWTCSCSMLLYLLYLNLEFSSKLDNSFFLSWKGLNQGAVCPEGVLSRWRRGHAKTPFCRAHSWRWEACALLPKNGVCHVLDMCCMYITSCNISYDIVSCHVTSYILNHIMLYIQEQGHNHKLPIRNAYTLCQDLSQPVTNSTPLKQNQEAEPTGDDHPGCGPGRQSAGVCWGPNKSLHQLFFIFSWYVCMHYWFMDLNIFKWLKPFFIFHPFWNDDKFDLWLAWVRLRSQVLFSTKPTVECVSAKESGYRSPDQLFDVKIPDATTQIGRLAFLGCLSLVRVTIPDSVTQIGNGAFSVCSSLVAVTIPNSMTKIGAGAFAGCSSLTSVTIPNSVTQIENEAFVNCRALTSITIPDSVTSIEQGAFAHCSSLTSVRIPFSVTRIGPWAFRGCSSLTSIAIPNVRTRIGADAFDGCRSLPFFLKVKRRRISWTCDALGQKKDFRPPRIIRLTKTQEPFFRRLHDVEYEIWFSMVFDGWLNHGSQSTRG